MKLICAVYKQIVSVITKKKIQSEIVPYLQIAFMDAVVGFDVYVKIGFSYKLGAELQLLKITFDCSL